MSVALGSYGIWKRASETTPDLVSEVERLGFGSYWVGGSPEGGLEIVESVLAATDKVGVATGIVNMWRDDSATVAASYHRIEQRHPGRFLLGLGIGHPESTAEYRRPYDTMVAYLNELEGAGVPRQRMILAALGPRALALAAQRTAGSHPYFTTPRHTKMAREVVGEGVVLAPEQTVVIDDDRERGLEVARDFAARYLALSNYRNSLLREGWTHDDLDGEGRDRLIDAVVLVGSAERVAPGIRAHLEAGADNVNIQVLGDAPMAGYRALASELLG
jgi:probable F420-dependent oxidoreductase